jgi:hypothetical protein
MTSDGNSDGIVFVDAWLTDHGTRETINKGDYSMFN